MFDFLFVRRNAPRWLILIIDVCISFTSIITAYFLRFNFNLPEAYFDSENLNSFYWVIPMVLLVRLISFLISRTYAGIVRYTGTKDAGRIFIVTLSGSLFLAFSNYISFKYNGIYLIPFSVIGIDFLTSIFS